MNFITGFLLNLREGLFTGNIQDYTGSSMLLVMALGKRVSIVGSLLYWSPQDRATDCILLVHAFGVHFILLLSYTALIEPSLFPLGP